MKDYLERGMRRVVDEGKMLDPAHVISEALQGTALGPLLLLIYINDLPNTVKCKLGFFVDDSIVYNRISSLVHCELLQKDLDSLKT